MLTRRMQFVLFVLLIVAVLVTVAPVLAQEVTAVPTVPPVVTPAPAPDFISITTIVYGLVIAILTGGSIAGVLAAVSNNKQSLDAAEKLYKSTPPETQSMLRDMFESVRDVNLKLLTIIDKITDGAPNDAPVDVAALRQQIKAVPPVPKE